MTAGSEVPGADTGAGPLPWINIGALLAVLVINSLAGTGGIGGATSGEISDSYASLFTPAGYVFSIWGLIYLLLAGFAVYQALPAQRDNPRLGRLGWLFALSCVFNCAWIFAWHYRQVVLSMLLMLGLLGTLIAVYRRLGIGRGRVGRREGLLLRLPFSVYLGWITVATVANAAVTLIVLGFDGGALAPLLTVAVIAAAVAIGILILLRRGDIAFALVLVWAFAGIAVRHWGAEPLLVTGALVAASLMAAAVVGTLLRRAGAPEIAAT